MSLAAKFEANFSGASRNRGEEYFDWGLVRIFTGSPTELTAIVAGSERYAVSLAWAHGKLSATCTCPHFRTEDVNCKHLWAVLLTADEKGFLAEAKAALYGQADAALERPSGRAAMRLRKEPAKPQPPQPPWREHLNRLAVAAAPTRREGPAWTPGLEFVYLLDLPRSRGARQLVLTLGTRTPAKQGGWKYAGRSTVVQRSRIASVPNPEDRAILSLLLGGESYFSYSSGAYDPYHRGAESIAMSQVLAQTVLPMVLRTGRCFLPFEKDAPPASALRWDDAGPWHLALEMAGDADRGWSLTGTYRRGDERIALDRPVLVVPGGFLVTAEFIAPLAADESLPWADLLQKSGAIAVPESERQAFMDRLLSSPHLPPIELPGELRFEEVMLPPRPCLTVSKPKSAYSKAYSRTGSTTERLHAKLTFQYGELSVNATSPLRGLYDAATNRYLVRDKPTEQAALGRLWELSLRPAVASWEDDADSVWTLAPAKLPRVARTLAEAGWHVVVEGKVFRQPVSTRASVVSGVDWFELHGEVAYGDTAARLPQLLAALRRGETLVTLDDGSYGLLPEEWLRRFGGVAMMGEQDGDHVRFQPRQAGLLDALLSTQPAVDCDERFRQVRRQLDRFQSVTPADQPAGFRGELRPYQRVGLGWMHFLRQFSFGGCLADDMGVGKTAQVLALLETRRELRVRGEIGAPSLAVVPKSLIFNWKQEIERFTPQLRVLDYTGSARANGDFSAYDLVLTTYGTLRRDAVSFCRLAFDYIVLDEAQAIKNARTESAKAVRLLNGSHRLALTGTPVENHLGELWSLFEFLNSGMLGASTVFQAAARDTGELAGEDRALLARSLRPFLLRRTKEQVARELPAKLEQTIFCEMEPKQRALYDELRLHYRDLLLGKIDAGGVAKSKLQVLAALLRLRQAACHPGLIDAKRAAEPSAKVDMLVDQLRDIVEEGHKALVFSQFTSLLKLVGQGLNAGKLDFEYLDGKTKDRQVPVERFQNDPACRLFLISLKAGGVGLNLTAADYVFILDPWWNPAVEAQAVDRAHRIGQTKQVFAYRLIARGTVEEKILELQQTKRGIADAILGEDNSLIRGLAREDIELLLS